MSVETWNLIADGRSCVDGLFVEQDEMRLVGRRLTGGPQDGVEIVDITFGKLQFTVIPTRGMSLWEARLGSSRFGWDSPVRGPVHPSRVALNEPSGLGWLDGFDELLVRCGLESNGAPEFDELSRLQYPLHGRIGNCSAHEMTMTVDHSKGELIIQGTVDESRFHFQKLRLTTTYSCNLDAPTLNVKDKIENFGGKAQSAQLLYHWNFGPPVLEGGSRIVAAAERVVPRNAHAATSVKSWQKIDAPAAGAEEKVYFARLRQADNGMVPVMLVNKDESLGVLLEYDSSELPCFTLWKNDVALADGYVVGIEPGTNWPNQHTFERQHGRVWNLEPGEAKVTHSRVTFLDEPTEIASAVGRIDGIRKQLSTKVDSAPDPSWCAE